MSESIKRYVKWYKSRINNEVAQRYLDRLNLNNQDAVEKFEIAYCDGSYLKHIKRQSSSPLSYKNFKQSFAADGLLDGSHQEKFRSGLIFPRSVPKNNRPEVEGKFLCRESLGLAVLEEKCRKNARRRMV